MARSTKQKIILADPAHAAATTQFMELLTALCRREGWNEYTGFQRFLTAGCTALRNPVITLTHGQKSKRWRENEDRYMGVVVGCREATKAQTMEDFSKMLAILAIALGEHKTDIVGPIFSEVAASAQLGQFFTPWNVSYLMAKMTLHDAKGLLAQVRAREDRGYITLQEPAVGCGGMVLAANQVLREQGLDPAKHAHWVCMDVDWNAVCGAYIQLTLTDSSALLCHGSALELKFDDGAKVPTMAALLHPKVPGFDTRPKVRVRTRLSVGFTNSAERTRKRPQTKRPMRGDRTMRSVTCEQAHGRAGAFDPSARACGSE